MIQLDHFNSILSCLHHCPHLIERIILNADATIHHDPMTSIIKLARHHHISIETVTKHEIQSHYSLPARTQLFALQKEFPVTPLKHVLTEMPQLILALDHIEDPHNYGALIRSSVAFGCSHIITPKKRQCPITSTVVKASAGTLYAAQIIEVSNLAQSLAVMKKTGYWIYGADHKTAYSIKATTLNFPMVLVVGNEGKGISKGTQQHLDERLKIELSEQVESLNVSVATGILLHHISSHLKK